MIISGGIKNGDNYCNYCFNEYDYNYHVNDYYYHVDDFYYSEISFHREGEKNVWAGRKWWI